MPADGPITADRPGRVAAADPPPAPLPSFAGSVARARRRVASAETERLYTADWTAFETWCARAGRICLPADAATVADFLTEAAATVSAGALGRRAAAIAARHRAGVHPVPTTDPAVRAVLRGARREATPRRPKPKTEAALTRMAGRCPGDLAGLRDRALLLLAAHGLGRAALVGLDVEHIRFTTTAAEFVPNVSAASAAGGSPVVIGRGANRSLCPVQALEDWLATSDTRYGPVFHKIDRGGGIAHHRLGTDAIRRILARRERHRGARPRRKPRPRAQPDGGA
jgi:integrase